MKRGRIERRGQLGFVPSARVVPAIQPNFAGEEGGIDDQIVFFCDFLQQSRIKALDYRARRSLNAGVKPAEDGVGRWDQSLQNARGLDGVANSCSHGGDMIDGGGDGFVSVILLEPNTAEAERAMVEC